MKFLKLDGRLDRLGYLSVLLSIVATLVVIFTLKLDISVLVFFPFFVWIFLVNSVKRGRDIGLNSLLTLLLSIITPAVVIYFYDIFFGYLQYLALLFILVLLIVPSSKKESRVEPKWEIVTVRWVIILASIFIFLSAIIPIHSCPTGDTQRDLTCIRMRSVSESLEMYRVDHSRYPTTQEGLDPLLDKYLKRHPKDTWGKNIQYELQGDRFVLFSYGIDREQGIQDEGGEDIFFPDCLD